jgi:serine/threonine-protein kinase RsbW
MPDTRADIALALTEACANVIQHAGSGEEYEVEVSARNRRCVIEVVNTNIRDREATSDDNLISTFQHRLGPDRAGPAGSAPADDADDCVSAIAEHGRGLKIIDAVADNLQLTRSTRHGTTVHFEKKLEWLPDAAGQSLLDSDDE